MSENPANLNKLDGFSSISFFFPTHNTFTLTFHFNGKTFDDIGIKTETIGSIFGLVC